MGDNDEKELGMRGGTRKKSLVQAEVGTNKGGKSGT